jgi:Potential Queuosine, Q, salvage protein family
MKKCKLIQLQHWKGACQLRTHSSMRTKCHVPTVSSRRYSNLRMTARSRCLFSRNESRSCDRSAASFWKSVSCRHPVRLLNDRSQKIPGQSYMGLLNSLKSQRGIQDNTLHLLDSIIQYFPCFRDESVYEGQRVVFWKRAQILLAETWYGIAV